MVIAPRPRPLVTWLLAAAVVSGCAVTAPDRTGAYEFRSQPGDLVFHWPGAALPVTYHAQAVGSLPEYVDRAVALWQAQFLYGEFHGVRVADTAGAVVRVELEGGAPPAAALTDVPVVPACEGRTNIPADDENRLTGPIVINLRWFGTYSAEDVANCLAAITAHEIGHSLGLLRHSDDPGDLMYGAPFGFPEVGQPSARDRAAVQELYHTEPDIRP
jgi:predicted Zn-dependent protease